MSQVRRYPADGLSRYERFREESSGNLGQNYGRDESSERYRRRSPVPSNSYNYSNFYNRSNRPNSRREFNYRSNNYNSTDQKLEYLINEIADLKRSTLNRKNYMEGKQRFSTVDPAKRNVKGYQRMNNYNNVINRGRSNWRNQTRLRGMRRGFGVSRFSPPPRKNFAEQHQINDCNYTTNEFEKLKLFEDDAEIAVVSISEILNTQVRHSDNSDEESQINQTVSSELQRILPDETNDSLDYSIFLSEDDE